MVNVPCPLLQEIYATKKVRDESGALNDLEAEIFSGYAEALYRTVLARKPKLALEIGMAYGLSSLAIASGLRDAAGGKLISIDPGQTGRFKRIGRLNIERAGYGENHELVEDFDYFALPMLLRRGQKIDFAYIDGWHTFDYCLLDFFYCDKMLNPGGVVAFNDAGYRAVHKVLGFVITHRRYREIDVGLHPDYRGRNPLVTTARWLLRRPIQDRYFEKLDNWEPDWNYFKSF